MDDANGSGCKVSEDFGAEVRDFQAWLQLMAVCENINT